MKILFIYFEIDIQIYNQIGIAYLSAALKEKGHKVSLIRINKPKKFKRIAETVKQIRPDLVGFSYVSNFSGLAEDLARKIRSIYDAPIIAGGIHATICPEETLNSGGFDYVCVGEGEEALCELVSKIENNEDTGEIKNIWHKNNGEISKNPIRELADLDKLPAPDIDIFYQSPQDVQRVTFMTQRGCPFSCTYCCNEFLNKLYRGKGPVVREMSVDKAIKDIRQIKEGHENIKDINFDDDTFTANKNRVKEFCSEYKKNINIPFAINSRPELLNDEIAGDLKKAGCFIVRVGIESGSEELRHGCLNRKMSNEDIRKGFEALKKNGISQTGFFIYGFPDETVNQMKESYDFLREIDPDGGSQISVFYPYPGTSLYEESERKGLLTDSDKKGFLGGSTTLDFDKEKKKTVKRYYEVSEDLYHEKGEDLRYIKKFYTVWYYPYLLLSLIIPRKTLWRVLVKTRLYHMKPVYTVNRGW